MIAEGACSSDDSGGVHGATFGDDSGSSSDGGHLLDGAPTEGDSASGDDGSTPTDGSTETDSGPSCSTGTVVVVGGGASSSFDAHATGTGGFASVSAGSSPGMAALPALVPFGTSFVEVFHAAGSNTLMSASFGGSGFSTPTAIAGTLARETPALAAAGTTLHLVYQENDDGGTPFKYFHASLTGTSWSAVDPVGTGADQSYGAHAPAAAADSTALVAGQIGDNQRIYVRSDS
ncbi:MAG TPA: hypothetical protein VF407_10190, partial [Polyangiaceae bacterium]